MHWPVYFRFTKVKHQYDLKLQEVEHLKERLEQGSHHQQLEEVNALKDSIGELSNFIITNLLKRNRPNS